MHVHVVQDGSHTFSQYGVREGNERIVRDVQHLLDDPL